MWNRRFCRPRRPNYSATIYQDIWYAKHVRHAILLRQHSLVILFSPSIRPKLLFWVLLSFVCPADSELANNSYLYFLTIWLQQFWIVPLFSYYVLKCVCWNSSNKTGNTVIINLARLILLNIWVWMFYVFLNEFLKMIKKLRDGGKWHRSWWRLLIQPFSSFQVPHWPT